MKMVYMIGMPGTGKSTIMKEFMRQFQELTLSTGSQWERERPADLLDTHKMGDVRVLGIYEDGEVFCGTDKLSMAVPPHAVEWAKSNPNETVFGEGDRLTNRKFFEAWGDNLTIIELTTSPEERCRRYKQRGSNQSDKFIQTVATKCKNIVDEFGDQTTVFGEEPGCVKTLVHETPDDTKRIVEMLFDEIKQPVQ